MKISNKLKKHLKACTPIEDLLSRTTSKRFQEFAKEMRRHEEALKRIYANDKLHIHVPEEIGSVHQVHPNKRLITTFYRCSICMKDLTENEVKKLQKK